MAEIMRLSIDTQIPLWISGSSVLDYIYSTKKFLSLIIYHFIGSSQLFIPLVDSNSDLSFRPEDFLGVGPCPRPLDLPPRPCPASAEG